MQIKFDITGMTCAACSARVEKVTAQIPGVSKADVNLLAGKMTVTTDSLTVKEQIIAAVENAGYGICAVGEKKPKATMTDSGLSDMKKRLIGSFSCLAVLMYFTMGHIVNLPLPNWYHGAQNALVAALLQLFLSLPVVYLNRAYYIKGIRSLLHRAPNMDSLIAVGSGAALVYGIAALFRMSDAIGHGQMHILEQYSNNLYFESAAMILTLITLGKFLETRAKGKTGDAIRQLMDLNPKTATVRRGDTEIEIPVEQVLVGDIVIIRSGSRIPVDGILISGRAAVDQSALTGESIPVDKTTGDTVSAGTICREGYFEMQTSRVGADTTLSQIIRLVEEAGGSKAPIARLADKIAGIFVPVVMIIAIITFFVWMVASRNVEFALNCAVSVLVISCPCALGLATPVAIMVGTGRGAGMGLLFKNAETLENMHRINTIVLDKTGTLTQGKPQVTDILPAGISRDELLTVAASLESRSEHPFALAIQQKAENLSLQDVSDFQVLPGLGISGVMNSVEYFGGNRRLMEQIGIPVPEYRDFTTTGKTPLYFASKKEFLGVIAAADVLKSDASDAVKTMKDSGLKVVMLTGDNAATAQAIASQACIDQVISDVLPGDKAGVISALQAEGYKVLMVGDGINDAPALVTADVGMAIGAGTDIAMESADVILMNNALAGIVHAISLSKATIRNIKQNLFWAFFYNLLGIPVAAGVLYPIFGILLSPMIGAAAMSLSSVFVVTNALRLKMFQPKISKEMKENPVMTTVIKVNGMMCSHCKARVEEVCKFVPGTIDAVVDLQAKTVTVTGEAATSALKKAILDAGYEVIE